MQLSWFSEYKGKIKTLYFKRGGKPPSHTGLGVKVDIFGNRWHCNAVLGDTLCCRPHYGYDTSGHGPVYSGYGEAIHTWNPYKWTFVDSEAEAIALMEQENEEAA
jgi:hypothetical protein